MPYGFDNNTGKSDILDDSTLAHGVQNPGGKDVNNFVRSSYDQLELDSCFKSDSVKSSVGQPDEDMLRLRKLRINNPNKIIIAHFNINLIKNKFDMLS